VNLYDVEKKEKQTLYKAENGTHIIKSEIDPHHPDLVLFPAFYRLIWIYRLLAFKIIISL